MQIDVLTPQEIPMSYFLEKSRKIEIRSTDFEQSSISLAPTTLGRRFAHWRSQFLHSNGHYQ